MGKNDPIQVSIMEMAHHFLYLPLHFAEKANYFNFIPPNYKISIESAPSKTDKEAYNLLIRGSTPGRPFIGFAVCDPAELILDEEDHLLKPVILAGLITNSSFWAVDRKTHTVRFLTDLALFDNIIAFREGTTSYGIARRIYRDANKPPSIQSVDPGNELTTLTSSKTGTMALTPDILGIDKLIADRHDDYKVHLALGTTPEYNNVLVTALLSRSDVVEEHPKLVNGLLRALQRAMLLVRFSDPRVIQFAMDDHGESESRIVGALRRAADAQVFPATINVSFAHWENAARAAIDSAGRSYDEKEHDRSKAIYKSAVEPYQGRINRIISEDILPRLMQRSEIMSNSTPFHGSKGRFVGLMIGLLLGGVGALIQILSMQGMVRVIQMVWLIVGIMLATTWAFSKVKKVKFESAIWGWIGTEMGIILTSITMAQR